MIVPRIDAYVEGRPMPSSSRVLMSEASVKRGGGWVKCCLGSSPSTPSTSPSSSGGIALSASSSIDGSSSSRLST